MSDPKPKEKHPEVNMACRRGSDLRTSGQCDSVRAIIMSAPNTQGVRQYRCVKCNYTWAVSTGGACNF